MAIQINFKIEIQVVESEIVSENPRTNTVIVCPMDRILDLLQLQSESKKPKRQTIDLCQIYVQKKSGNI